MTREEKLDWLYRLKSEIFVLMPKEWIIPMSDALGDVIKALEQDPTTKNDLGVDAISRADALALYCDKCGVYNCISKCSSYRAVEKMPPITPQEPRWIPVSERLPDTEDEVLCWYEYYHWSKEKILPEYGIGQYIGGDWFGMVSIGRDVRVIAWQPLPEPYKEEQIDGMTIEKAISWLLGIAEHEGEDIPIYDTDVEAIKMAIDTMRKYQKIEQILKDIPYGGDATVRRIQEVIEDGSENNHHAHNT